MKKYFLTAIILGVVVFSFRNLLAQQAPRQVCPAVELMRTQEEQNPALKAKRMQTEKLIADYIQKQKNKPTPASQDVYTIPAVVHVLWNQTYQNVSDARINAMIQSFNKDLSKQNSDFTTICPPAFQSKAADCELQICLARQTPGGAPTNGIIHTYTSYPQFPVMDASKSNFLNYMKFSSQGGDDVWDHNRYLNIWVCELESTQGIFYAYAQFPDQDTINPDPQKAATDGIVIQSAIVPGGTNPDPVHNLGRSIVHEFGHYMFLYHIWGDDGQKGSWTHTDGICNDGIYQCDGTDYVLDTPNQCDCHYGKPTFPQKDACGNVNDSYGDPGDPVNGTMYMNFMDYVDDDHKVMFTAGQRDRMQAAMYYFRRGLFTSNGCVAPGTGTGEIARNHLVDIYPNPSNGMFNVAPIAIGGIMNNGNTNTVTIEVYNVFGEKVYSTSTLNHQPRLPSMTNDGGQASTLDLSAQPGGVYFLNAKSDKEIFIQKIIIQK